MIARIMCFFFAACATGAGAHAAPERLPARCQSLIEKSVPVRKQTEPPPDAAAWARSRKINPVVVSGDFDSNGRRDWASIGTSPTGQKIAVCLSHGGRMSLRVFDHGGCGDLIVLHPKGSVVHNHELGRNVRLRRDSIGAACFEKAGQLISLGKNGRFRVFTHMD